MRETQRYGCSPPNSLCLRRTILRNEFRTLSLQAVLFNVYYFRQFFRVCYSLRMLFFFFFGVKASCVFLNERMNDSFFRLISIFFFFINGVRFAEPRNPWHHPAQSMEAGNIKFFSRVRYDTCLAIVTCLTRRNFETVYFVLGQRNDQPQELLENCKSAAEGFKRWKPGLVSS